MTGKAYNYVLTSCRQFFMPAGVMCLLCLLLLIAPLLAQAESNKQNIMIVYQNTHTFTQQLVEQLENSISSNKHHVDITTLDESSIDRETLNRQHLIIAIGSKCTNILLKNEINAPILSALMPRHLISQLEQHHPARKNWSHLLIDQPVERYFHLITEIMGKHQKTGIITGPNTQDLTKSLKVAAKKTGHLINTTHIENTDKLSPALMTLNNNVDVLLTLPDPSIYNKNTIRGVLLSSYRNNLPIVGFSSAYVKAGAIAAIYSNPSQISDQISRISMHYLKNGSFKQKIFYPDDFSIAVNNKVARSLGIYPAHDASILRNIKKADKSK